MPEVFRRLHPRFKTPWLALVLFAGIAPILILLPGRRQLRRHALLARRDALVHGGPCLDRPPADADRDAGGRLPRAAEPRAPRRRLAALRDLRRDRDRRLVPRDRRAEPARRAGSGSAGSSPGSSGTASTGAGVVRAPLTETRQGAAGVRRRARARVSPHPRPDRPRAAVRRRARRRVPPRGGARRAGRRAHRDRGAARAAARRRAARRGAARPTTSSTRRWRSATRTACASSPASSAGGARRPEIVARGRAARRRDHRARLAAQGPDEPPARRVRRRPSTA